MMVPRTLPPHHGAPPKVNTISIRGPPLQRFPRSHWATIENVFTFGAETRGRQGYGAGVRSRRGIDGSMAAGGRRAGHRAGHNRAGHRAGRHTEAIASRPTPRVF